MRTPSRRRRLERLFAPSGGGGAAFAWDTPGFHPDYIEGDEFDFPDISTAVAAWNTPERFNSYVDLSGTAVSIDTGVQYNGHNTLKIPEGRFGVGGDPNYLDMERTISSVTDLWMRVIWRIPSTYASNVNRMSLGYGVGNGGKYIGNIYNVARSSMVESWEKRTSNVATTGVPQALSGLKNRWNNSIVHYSVDAGSPRVELFSEGVSLYAQTISGWSITGYTALDADFDALTDNAATPDPTNNYLHIGEFQYVPGADPFGVL